MAEVVQYHLEQMVGELEDLERRELFTKPELKAIVKKRTKFEYALRRRRAGRADFLRYVEYEINVDALRRQRKQRMHQQGFKTTLSDFSITQRIIAIFERAVVRHQGDLQLWLQFVEFIKSRRRLASGEDGEESDGHSRLLSRVFARAISAHPYESQLWIKAAAHELEVNMNGNAARVLMQRALRLSPDNRRLWTEYFRLELLLVEKIKARRRVLGIGQAADEKAADGGFIDLPQLAEEADDDLMVEKLTEKALAQLDQKAANSELSDEKRAAMAQQADAYLQGAVAQIVFEQAVQAIPDDLEFRQEFISVLSQFADMTQLRQLVLDSIQRDFAADAEARAFLCTVHLGAVSAESPELVDALQRAAAGFKQALGALDTPAMWSQYIAFLAQWRETCAGTDSLRAYLAALLKRAVAAISDNRDTRLSAELALACASELESSHGAASMELLNWLADATQRFAESAELWHRRLAALIAASHDGTVASGAASLARIDSLFSGQALSQAAGSRALWDLWFDWTEQCFGRGQVSVGQVQSRFISAFARVTQQRTVQAVSTDSDGMARLRALLAHLQVRYVDWAWGLPAGCSLSEAVELAHDDSDSEPDSDERMEPQTAGNLDAVRQAYRNVSRQAFPTPGFYRRCIELETDAKQQTMLHEMACRVDAADTQPWLAYLAHLVGLQQLTQASQVYWRASKSIPEDQQPAFAAAYQAMFSS